MTKVLIIAPHPDDETLGCGGTILRHKKENDKVHFLIFTHVYENMGWDKQFVKKRDLEINQIIKTYNFDTYKNFGIPAKEIDKTDLSILISKLDHYIKKIKPEIIYFPYFNDIHTDHQIISKVTFSCLKSFRNPFIKQALMYEVLSETNFNHLHNNSFKPNYYVDISKFIKKKLSILKIYKSEFKPHPFPRSEESVKALSIIRGSEAGFKFAEAFKIVFFKK